MQNNIGYFLTYRDLLSPNLDDNMVFRPLEPQLKVQYNPVWKRQNIFSKSAGLFREKVQEKAR